jgi:hypothetical protein
MDVKLKGKGIPVQASHRVPEILGSQISNNRHMKVVWLSANAPATFTPRNIPGTHLC